MNEHENEIRDLLGAEIGEEPPVVGGPAAVFAGARHRVVRTRAITGALSMAAVLGVAAGAVALSGGSAGRLGGQAGGQAGGAAVAPGAGGQAATSAAEPGKSPKASDPGVKNQTAEASRGSDLHPVAAPTPGPGQVLTDGRSTAELLKQLLPAGLTSSGYVIADSYQPQTWGVATFGGMSVDDGTHRPVGVTAQIDQAPVPEFEHMSCASVLSDPIDSDCRESSQGDGSRVIVFREDIPPNTAGEAPTGVYAYVAYRIFPNGQRFSLRADNSNSLPPAGKGAKATRTAPLLTPDQLKAIVLDHRWALTVSAEFAQQAQQDIKPVTDMTQKS